MLAAAGLFALIDWAARRVSRRKLWYAVSIAVLAAVLVGTYGWAWAFTNIYRNPTTRVAASRWIYENIPTAITLHFTADGAAQMVQLPFSNMTILNGDNQPIAVQFEVEQTATLESATLNRLIDLQADSRSGNTAGHDRNLAGWRAAVSLCGSHGALGGGRFARHIA